MKEKLMVAIEQGMLHVLDNAQMKSLHQVLENCLFGVTISQLAGGSTSSFQNIDNSKVLESFVAAKHVEGCSEKTLSYYYSTLGNYLKWSNKDVMHVTTDDLRCYLAEYQSGGRTGKVTLDNIRRIISTFFSWLEDENYIIKSPARRIHKVKCGKTVKETYTDEELELLRDNCTSDRDLAMIYILSSTGIRVGELVGIDINDIDFVKRECVVLGKGSKERIVYFDARTKIHLQRYLKMREDSNPALFVSLLKPHERLEISGVEIRIRNLGRKLGMSKVHPHKFRRTLATRAIDKGMPIEQVQHLLGHQQIDTTMQYAMVNQNNVKLSHKRFIA